MIAGKPRRSLTPSMERALRYTVQNTFSYAGRDCMRTGEVVTVAASTLRGLAHRGMVTLGINPDGGMMATPAPEGIHYYHTHLEPNQPVMLGDDGEAKFAVVALPLPGAHTAAVEAALFAMRQVIDTGALKHAPAHLDQAHVDRMRLDLHEAIELLAKESQS